MQLYASLFDEILKLYFFLNGISIDLLWEIQDSRTTSCQILLGKVKDKYFPLICTVYRSGLLFLHQNSRQGNGVKENFVRIHIFKLV